MNTCKTCKHLERTLSDRVFFFAFESRHAKCAHPRNGINPVNGKPFRKYAENARATYGGCGREGKNWEKR